MTKRGKKFTAEKIFYLPGLHKGRPVTREAFSSTRKKTSSTSKSEIS
jgi:hypothetical protein